MFLFSSSAPFCETVAEKYNRNIYLIKQCVLMPDSELSRPLRVFLCHASDDKPAVRALYGRLVEDGIDVWFDEESLIGGQDWRKEIPKAIRNSDAVLVCLSRRAINKSGYVQKEIAFALDIAEEQPEEANFIIPGKLEECDAPQRLQHRQWVNLFENNGYIKLKRALNLRASQVAYREDLSENVSAETKSDVFIGPEGQRPPLTYNAALAQIGASTAETNTNKKHESLKQPYRLAKVVISRSGDSLVDASRVGEIHHLLASYPGPDRFCLLIRTRSDTLQLDFPNDTTTLDDMMIAQLKDLHGVESVQVSMGL